MPRRNSQPSFAPVIVVLLIVFTTPCTTISRQSTTGETPSYQLHNANIVSTAADDTAAQTTRTHMAVSGATGLL
jgi:hypothetical protein